MSLPHATQAQINEMNKVADEKMKRDGIVERSIELPVVESMHPMLAHHEDPLITDDQDHEVEDNVQDDQEETEYIASKPQETSQQMNFRIMRERLEKVERERDEAMKYAMSMNQPKQQQPVAQEEEDYLSSLGIDTESLAEGKHIKAVLKEVRELKKELSSYRSQSYEETTKIKLASNFPDYDRVMTQENLNALEQADPELAEMIGNTPDMYKRAKLAYDMVKRFGIYKDTTYDQEKMIAHKNASKPKPLASVSPQQADSPLSKANAFANMPLSKEVKNQLHKEMIAAMKGR